MYFAGWLGQAKLGFGGSILPAWEAGLALGYMSGLRVLALNTSVDF